MGGTQHRRHLFLGCSVDKGMFFQNIGSLNYKIYLDIKKIDFGHFRVHNPLK